MGPSIIAVIALMAIVAASSPASAWYATAQPIWTAPYPSAPWNFKMRIVNGGNASMEVTGLDVWTNWGDPPTESTPQHTSTVLPTVIPQGGMAEFNFTLNVPANAAGHSERLDAELYAANPNGTSWTSSFAAHYPGWNFTVLSSPPAAPPSSGSQFPFYSVISIALISVSIALRVFFYRRRHRMPPAPPAYNPYAPPQYYGGPPPPGYPSAPPPSAPPPAQPPPKQP